MPETTDTNFQMTAAGVHDMTAIKPCIKKLTKNDKPYYTFEFSYVLDGRVETHKEIIFPSQAGLLLKAFKCKEVKPGVFEWEKDEILNRRIRATVAHQDDKKDPTRKRAVIIAAEPLEEEPSIPF
jgi:hypothetical protein